MSLFERMQCCLIALLCGVFYLVGYYITGAPALAKPLSKEKCQSLRTERNELKKNGVADYLSKGPEWVKNFVDRKDLDKLERYLTIDGDITFKCKPLIVKTKPTKNKNQADKNRNEKVVKSAKNKPKNKKIK